MFSVAGMCGYSTKNPHKWGLSVSYKCLTFGGPFLEEITQPIPIVYLFVLENQQAPALTGTLIFNAP
jgi:hypothetical protein